MNDDAKPAVPELERIAADLDAEGEHKQATELRRIAASITDTVAGLLALAEEWDAEDDEDEDDPA